MIFPLTVPPFVTSVAVYCAAAGRLTSSAAKTTDRIGISSIPVRMDCSPPAAVAFLKKIARCGHAVGRTARCRMAALLLPFVPDAADLRFLLRPGLAL